MRCRAARSLCNRVLGHHWLCWTEQTVSTRELWSLCKLRTSIRVRGHEGAVMRIRLPTYFDREGQINLKHNSWQQSEKSQKTQKSLRVLSLVLVVVVVQSY